MERFSNAELADMHFIYGVAGGNALEAERYRDRFPDRDCPRHRFFTNLHARLRETGRLQGRREGAGRPNVNQEQRIVTYFEENPRESTRSAARNLGISSNSIVWRVLKEQNFHPYHFQRVQELLPRDYLPRQQFSQWLLTKREANVNFLQKILFSDEAYFTREGVFNIHNSHLWNDANPHAIRVHSYQHRFSVNVWAGILNNNIIGPYLMPSPLNGRQYNNFLQHTLPELLEDITLDVRQGMWFQQDGAPPHY